jgi:hypothetical protein
MSGEGRDLFLCPAVRDPAVLDAAEHARTGQQGGQVMQAAVGDRLVVHSVHVDGPVRDGRVVEVRGPDGSPPYVVEWADTGHQSLYFPGADATVEHFATHE